jgi:hypothetical protein
MNGQQNMHYKQILYDSSVSLSLACLSDLALDKLFFKPPFFRPIDRGATLDPCLLAAATEAAQVRRAKLLLVLCPNAAAALPPGTKAVVCDRQQSLD